uniref:Uncharacterized protein n=1 Tax=Chrysemys picta bellii TaxID=8478 RepID=A0A8C3HMB4_CHRPI
PQWPVLPPAMVEQNFKILTCAVCLDYFKDPVSLDCGHHFCQACITRCWEALSTNFHCPECRETFSQRNFKPNRQLRNIVEASRTLTLEPEVQMVCEKHNEDLKKAPASSPQLQPCPPELHRLTLLKAPWAVQVHSLVCRPSVWSGHTLAVPNNPERFDIERCVLGCEGFTSGRHYWEVEVGVGGVWGVGVARESVRRKGRISLNPEQGIWAVRCSEDQYWAHTSPEQIIPFPPSRAPRRIRVYLDYERGRVTFFDVGTGDPIFTFPPASFAGERIRPFLWVLLSVRLL